MPVPGEFPALDAETRVPILLGVSIGFIVASTLVVALRVFTRQYIVHGLGPDDYTIVLAQFLNFGVSATTILQAKYGLGRHVWLVDNESNIRQLKSLFAAMIVYNLSQIITKISFLLQYRRIFQDKFTQRACLVLLVFLGTWGFAQEFLVGHACVPASIIFPSLVGKCIGALTVWYLTSIMNIVTDFIVFLVPMPAIRHLQLRRKQKVLVTGVFCLGFFTCIISIVRLFTLRGAINTDDPTWDNVPTSYWTVVELNCGIMCASIATLRPLLRHVFPSLSSHSATDYYLKQPSTPKGSSVAGGGRRASNGTADPIIVPAAVTGGGMDGIYALRDVESGGSQDGFNKSSAAEYYGWTGYGRNGVPASKVSTSVRGGKAGRDPGAAGEDGSFGSTLGGGGPRQIRVTRETTFSESRNNVSWK